MKRLVVLIWISILVLVGLFLALVPHYRYGGDGQFFGYIGPVTAGFTVNSTTIGGFIAF
jgi:hypothetical protein